MEGELMKYLVIWKLKVKYFFKSVINIDKDLIKQLETE